MEIHYQSNILMLSPHIPVQRAIDAMVQAQQSCVLVVENQRLIGIFTERDLTWGTAQQLAFETLSLGALMTPKPQTVNIHASKNVFQLVQRLTQNRLRHLPVLDDHHRVVGLITPQSIRDRLKPEYMPYLWVGSVMTTQVIQGQQTDSILVLVQQMAAHRISCVVIMDESGRKPLGLITERDIARLHTQGVDFRSVTAGEVMPQPLTILFLRHSLWQVHQTMQELNVQRLVICYPHGELAGLITQTQLLNLMEPLEIYQVMAQMKPDLNDQTHELQSLNQQHAEHHYDWYRVAPIDELTQVANRRHFDQYYRKVWQRLEATHQSIALLFVDIDHFTAYNETYGHNAAERCLFEIAQALQRLVRGPEDLLARYDGEKFVVLLLEQDLGDAERLAQAMLEQVFRLQMEHATSPTSDYVTISIGATASHSTVAAQPEMLIQQADQMLNHAKQQGRDRYHLAAELLPVRVEH
ncbi:diguanylate cyclase [filamentous cyanobacterium LEGE 11480]|uniref:Diguanylate cyclase n=1 Tax=Romeriopsis navalis LEGE 11480 TaxID=2777977 RepID=A0A928VR86_9CYAN|nr:diguanylate cyclase [Romeriopsis navalis LEGE 11480]